MQAKNFLLMLTLTIVSLSGCFGSDDGPEPCEEHTHDDGTVESHGDCENGGDEACHDDIEHNATEADHCDGHGSEGNGEDNGTTEPPAPNQLPIPVLTMTTEDGTVLDDFSAITPEMTITFSAVGSSDPDGSIDLIGLTVKDANSTRNTQLMVDGDFVDAVFKFDHVGVVNVTMRVLDDRGEGVVLNDNAYVNEVETGSAARLAQDSQLLHDPEGSGCEATLAVTGTPLIWSKFAEKQTFNVNNGAQWVDVAASGVHAVAICTEAGDELGSGSDSAQSDGVTALPAGTQYYVLLHPDASADAVEWTITVHYEPKQASE